LPFLRKKGNVPTFILLPMYDLLASKRTIKAQEKNPKYEGSDKLYGRRGHFGSKSIRQEIKRRQSRRQLKKVCGTG
jgi:hypothetical protein